jgi:hypothetical protein
MSGLKDIPMGLVAAGRGTLAGGHSAPMSDVIDYMANVGRGTLAAPVLSIVELFDIFAVEHGDWPALVLRLVRHRWPGVLVVDAEPKRPGRPLKGFTVTDLVLINEVTGIKAGCKERILKLGRDGWTAKRIAATTKVKPKTVRGVLNGGELSDREALRLHLLYSGKAKPGHSADVLEKKLSAWAARYSRAAPAQRERG